MPTTLPIRCSCAALRGTALGVSANRGNRVVCYCDDCQSFAYFLGRADQILDAHGGTDIFQTSPARLEMLGPIRARVNARFAKGDKAQLDANDRLPVSQLFRFVPMLLMARLRGDHTRSPFFDSKTGELRVEPHVLTEAELAEVERNRDAS